MAAFAQIVPKEPHVRSHFMPGCAVRQSLQHTATIYMSSKHIHSIQPTSIQISSSFQNQFCKWKPNLSMSIPCPSMSQQNRQEFLTHSQSIQKIAQVYHDIPSMSGLHGPNLAHWFHDRQTKCPAGRRLLYQDANVSPNPETRCWKHQSGFISIKRGDQTL